MEDENRDNTSGYLGEKGSNECSICGDMVVGMSVNCIASQEYRGKADLDFTRLAYLRQ